MPLRWVLVRDPMGEFRLQMFLCMDQDAATADILAWFVRRWAVEGTFGEARRHLGVETQRQWSDLASVRRALWAEAALRTSRQQRDLVKVLKPMLDRLTTLACYAA